MSNVTIHGHVLLNADIVCDGDIYVGTAGTVTVSHPESEKEAYFNCSSNEYKYTHGRARLIQSTHGDITVNGIVDGDARGFDPDKGPGASSALTDSSGNKLAPGYGASHAGVGGLPSTVTQPDPLPAYGSHEAPTSLGSGSSLTNGGAGVHIKAAFGEVSVDGTVTMNGQDGWIAPTGGGAGGSVWAEGWNLRGTGLLSAEGGSADWTDGGGGSGGYVSMWAHGSNLSSYTVRVSGSDGADNGKTWVGADPILEERFTGHLLNERWWEVVNPPIVVDNCVEMDTTSDLASPSMRSRFTVQGNEITTDIDIRPLWGEPNFYRANLEWYLDDANWVQMSKRVDQFVGRYSVDNVITEVASHGHVFGNASLRLHKQDSTFFFQYYDGTSVPVTVFDDVIEPFADREFKLGVSLDKQAVEDGDIIVQYFRLNDENIANRYISLAGPPTDADNVSLSVITGSYQMYGMDFYLEGNRVRWDQEGLSHIDPPYTFSYGPTEYTLTAAEVAQGYVDIPVPPELTGLQIDRERVVFDIVKGTSQRVGVDFDVNVEHSRVFWKGMTIDGILTPGNTIRLMWILTPWYIPAHETLEAKLEVGDLIRVMYSSDTTEAFVKIAFDNLTVTDGILAGHQSDSALVYVDSSHGSDTNYGDALNPLQNLFVATKWARPGGVVTLYDGTYNPAAVWKKDITVQGASGVKPVVTSAYVQDSTGEGWENNALGFRQAQGIVRNLRIIDSTVGVRLDYCDAFEVRECDFTNVGTAVAFHNSDPAVMRNTISGASVGADFVRSPDAYVYSNVVQDTSVAFRFADSTRSTVQSNTVDDCVTAVSVDGSSTDGLVASNSLTNLTNGIIADATTASYSNNYWGTTNAHVGAVDSSGDFTSDPLYVDQTGRDYHLTAASPNIGAGLDTYDRYFLDRDGANRALGSQSEVGAYEFIDGSHSGTDWYVNTYGNDHYNFGGAFDPYRTLDKAMTVADSTVHIDGGRYDTWYLSLREENIALNSMMFWVGTDHAISYITLNQQHVDDGWVPLPGIVPDPGVDHNVALSVLDRHDPGNPATASTAQEYGTDFVIEAGKLVWRGYDIESLIEVGDTLRVMFFGVFVEAPPDVLSFSHHFSNLDLGSALFVSANGSDSTVLGGDGTNSGGDGSLTRPFRTVTRAMADSSTGDNIVVMAGEYPMFDGADGRVIVPITDTTSVMNKWPREYVEDLFATDDFRNLNHIQEPLWAFQSFGDSTALNADGYMHFTYDGTNPVSATSTFTFTGDFEVTAQVRSAVDPVVLTVHDSDNTASFYYGPDYTSAVDVGGDVYYCRSSIDVGDASRTDFIIEYLCVNSDHTRGREMPLAVPAWDCSNSAVNIVGGTSQEYGTDYVLKGDMLSWDGLGMEVRPGDVVRVKYRSRELYDSATVRFTLDDDFLRMRVRDSDGYRTVMRKILAPSDGTWGVTLSMASKEGEEHVCQRGVGLVSKFKVVADDVQGTPYAAPYNVRTERRTVAFYNGGAT